MIKTVAFISTDSAKRFGDDVAERVRDIQKEGQYVEIQYGMSTEGGVDALFTALLIGRIDDV